MINAFYETLRGYDIKDHLESFTDTFTKDYTHWNCVDGEEGDYGSILYYNKTELVCEFKSTGGDNDWYEFTPYGKKLLLDEMLRLLTKTDTICK